MSDFASEVESVGASKAGIHPDLDRLSFAFDAKAELSLDVLMPHTSFAGAHQPALILADVRRG